MKIVPRKYTSLGAFVVLSAVAFSCQAAYAACAFGVSGDGISLQQALNARLTAAPSTTADCLAEGSDALWSVSGTGSSTIVLELTANSNVDPFGIYDSTNPANRLEVFNGAAVGDGSANSTATITFTPVGPNWTASVTRNAVTTSATFGSAVFGFYLSLVYLPNPTIQANYASQTFLNTDGPGAPNDHLYAYKGNGATFNGSAPSNLIGQIFGSNSYILAWEDGAGNNSDRDFQDFVVVVKDIAPVPLPAAAWLMLSGLLGVGAFARKQKLSA
jgi:hypothetical protein